MSKQQPLHERLHRTWLSVLINANLRELAALVVDAELTILSSQFGSDYGIAVDLPPSSVAYVHSDESAKRLLEETLGTVANGYLTDRNGDTVTDFSIEYRVRLLDAEENWRAVVKELIVRTKDANQGVISEKAFAKRNQQVLMYNEMKFASQAEIRVAQELERRKVLFFPLPLAVRGDTGDRYRDHREIDFLVCLDGAWGALEVAHHPGRYEQDSEKDGWLKKSGLLCVQHYTSERCYNDAASVVAEFLHILSKHKK